MFPIAIMGGILSVLKGAQTTGPLASMMQNATTNAAKPKFSFMDMLGSAAARGGGGGGRSPHTFYNPAHGMETYQDMSRPDMNHMLNLMQAAQYQQHQRQPVQVQMHPIIIEMLKRAGVR